MATRTPLAQLGLSAGKKARLHRILHQHGLRNGTGIFLPYDQGLEHGPRDFLPNPLASDPRYILRLAVEGGFNGIAIQIGLAEKFYWDYAGEVPLILKLNGRTEIPPAGAFWSLIAYDLKTRNLIENPLKRYSIGDRTPGLKKNADGSLDIYLQKDQPAAGASNWLPVGEGPFMLVVRIYEPGPSVFDGSYKLPALETLE